jgi:hypothetical protein
MKRQYAIAVNEEAARLFGKDAMDLFVAKARPDIRAVEDAIVYAHWVRQYDPRAIGQFLGNIASILHHVRECTARRVYDPKYSEMVSELVWFAQRWRPQGAKAAA